jgi:predicted alpha/beta-fold hydrolase
VVAVSETPNPRSDCPLCGSPVSVHTSDEGTSSYVPLVDAAELERLRRIEEAARALTGQTFGFLDQRAFYKLREALSETPDVVSEPRE